MEGKYKKKTQYRMEFIKTAQSIDEIREIIIFSPRLWELGVIGTLAAGFC